MMKKAIFAILFLLGFMFVSLNYAKAEDAYPCSSDKYYPPGTPVRCGLLPNFCIVCDAYNYVVYCTPDSSGHLPTTISKETCEYRGEDLLHGRNSSLCTEKPSCKPPPPICPFIDCTDTYGNNPPITGAGGSCTYPGANDPQIPGCTALCPDGSGRKVPGFVVSVCQSSTPNCYFNNCHCYPNAGECAATLVPAVAPAPVCPAPPQVTNIRVSCPYCGT